MEREFDYGATFIMELILNEPFPSDAETANPGVKQQLTTPKNSRILVVDDEPVVRSSLARILTKIGYSVNTIGDAKTALDIFSSGKIYEVIFTDVRMPWISGIEIYSYILDKMPTMKNKIIFITGDVMDTNNQAFLTKNN
jgi:CheY-like chemotaxis protein